MATSTVSRVLSSMTTTPNLDIVIPTIQNLDLTLTELKEEESFLLKERRNLRNQLATWLLNFEKERATNEKLKRIKCATEPSSLPFSTKCLLSSAALTSMHRNCWRSIWLLAFGSAFLV